MFAQIIKGKAKDEAGLRKQFDRWAEELKPTAEGFLGGTTGIAKDGSFFTIARFESEEVARRNSDSPEQGRWMEETRPYLEDVSFTDCTEVDLLMGGGSDDAGFVQVMEGRTNDVARLRQLGQQMEPELRKARPDVIGGVVAWHPDGSSFTQVMYFESEGRAREMESSSENAGPPPEFNELMGEITYLDLQDPWFV